MTNNKGVAINDTSNNVSELSGVQRVLRNSAATGVARASSLGARLVVIMILARYLGTSYFGDYNYVIAIVGLFEFLSDFGLNDIAVREISRHRHRTDELFGSVLILKALIMLLMVGILLIVAYALPSDDHVRTAILLYGASVILNFFVDTYFVVYRATERMSYEAVIVFVERWTYVLILVLFVMRGVSFSYLFWANIISAVIKLILGTWVTATRFHRPTLHVDWSVYRNYLHETIPVGVSQLINSVSLRVGIVLLSLLGTSRAVGIFAGPYRIVDAVGLMSIVLLTAIFPVMGRRAKWQPQGLTPVMNKTLRALLFVAVPASIGLAVLARPTVDIVLGNEYSEAANVLTLLALILVPVYLNRMLSFAFIAINRQKEYAYITGSALVITVILDLLLIPQYGLWGAVAGTIVGEVARLAFGYYYYARFASPLELFVTLKRLAPAAIALLIALIALERVSWLLAGFVGLAAYLAIAWFSGAVEEERQIIRRLLEERKRVEQSYSDSS